MRKAVADNERTLRNEMWRRYAGDDWAAFDALPATIRERVATHAYDAWSVNVMMLWQHYKRLYGRNSRAERALMRYLDYCERLEREAFASRYRDVYDTVLPHDAACATILR